MEEAKHHNLLVIGPQSAVESGDAAQEQVESTVPTNDQSTSDAAYAGPSNRSNKRTALKRKSGPSNDSKAKKKKSKSVRTPRPNYTIEQGEDMLLIISNVSHSDSVWRPKRKGRKKKIKRPVKGKGQMMKNKNKKIKKRVKPARPTVIVNSETQGTTDPDLQIEQTNVSHSGFGADQWGQKLPVEVLVNIFQYVVHRDGAVPFLCRCASLDTFYFLL